MPTKVVSGPDGEAYVEMTPEEAAALDSFQSQAATTAAHTKATTTFAVSEDAERLALVRERAEADPAFAALADLTLKNPGG